MEQLNLKEWFIKIGDNELGPFSINDLRYDRRINFDTLVRKLNWPIFIPLGQVKELKEFFDDEDDVKQDKSNEKKIESDVDFSVLADRRDPNQYYFYILIILFITGWICYRIWG
ncbi:MAG: DUF4339 domain-containing protein [Parachlamydiales bacterium]|nr:DUF4339 domain-containing protein [Parachlamydiales bacterium]